MKEKLNFITTQYKKQKINVKFFDKNNKEIPKEQVKSYIIKSDKNKGQIIYIKKDL